MSIPIHHLIFFSQAGPIRQGDALLHPSGIVLHIVPRTMSWVVTFHLLADDLPPLAELETLDLSDCAGVIELGGLATRFPKLRRLVLARTASTKDDVAAIAARGVEVVL